MTTATKITNRAFIVAKIQTGFAVLAIIILILVAVLICIPRIRNHQTESVSRSSVLLGVILTLLGLISVAILFKAVNKRSLKLCYFWWIINMIAFIITLLWYICDIFKDNPKSSVLHILETIFDGVALKVVYDFILEIRKTDAPNEVPFSQIELNTEDV